MKNHSDCSNQFLCMIFNLQTQTIIALSAIAILISGCAKFISRSDSSGEAVGHYRSRANKSTANKKRAAYWSKRGYDFDPFDTSAAQMDYFASLWSAPGWNAFKADAMRSLAARADAERQARKNAEQVSDLPRYFALPQQKSPSPKIVPIPPKPRPLPAIGP